ncbi:MAG: pentapeptide repeat-containing protein, partial [Microcoleaceae cyanobacterium]
MNSDSGMSVDRPTSVLHKSIQVNLKDLSKAIGKGAVDFSFGKWDSLAKDGVEVLSALGLAANAEEIAGLLIYRSLLAATKNLIDEKPEINPDKFKVKTLQAKINIVLENSNLSIDQSFFNHPDKDSIFEVIKPAIKDWLIEHQMSPADAVAISQRLPIYFTAALHQEWGSHPKDYAVLKQKLDTPFTQANQRIQAWMRYQTWLQKQVEEPVFLEAFSLKQIYVPLRAYYKRKIETQPDEELAINIRDHQQQERVVIDLGKELETWLNIANKNDAIRLISGGPGIGKSSFCKMFAAKIAENNNIRVLFIPLHHFEPSDNLINAVGQFVEFDGILPHNPLDSEDREKRLLIIFDGLDELAMQGKIAEKTAQDFVREVQRQVDRLNQRETCLQILISGRELVVQANQTDFRQPGQILHLLPYFIAKEERNRKNYIDDKQLLEQDQRQLWWQKYSKVTGHNYTGLPPELNRGNLIEITAQPLLNYLVSLSFTRKILDFSENTNLNAIYDDLLKAIYERGWTGYQHRTIQGIEEKDFIRILEEIALASWHGNGRTTTVREIEAHCESSNLKRLLQQFQESFETDSTASITRLMTAFYFRQQGHNQSGDKTFEFTHKSFGEYLTARRIVREVKSIHHKLQDARDNYDEDWNEQKALERWALVCGPSAMDEYLFNFVLDEMRLQNPNLLVKWQKTLCDLISFMLKRGMPMEKLTHLSTFQQKNIQARNAEEALLVVLNSCARLTKKLSDINFPDKASFGTWISRLQGQRLGEVFCLNYLSFLDLSQCVLDMRDFFRANLAGANLEEANLWRANLQGANLEGVNLGKARLEGANLDKADLERADLRKAKLEGANLAGANLQEPQ